jgi:hypothetical protein
MTIDVPGVMAELARQRKAFHSEADFQHAFAWELHLRHPEAAIRLERPLRTGSKNLHLDFLLQLPGKAVAIELKYKTRTLQLNLDGEDFHLSSHSAQDLGRYDFIKDICRLEQITSTLSNCEGWAIMLTNDTAYWKIPQNNGTVDAAFRITEGRTLNGQLAWTDAASAGTKKNRESDLPVLGNYKLRWSDYSTTDSPSYGQFRFLAVNVHSLSDVG